MVKDGDLERVNERVREYVKKYKNAKSESIKRKYKSMINNQVGYEMLKTGKSCTEIKKEWGLNDE